MPDPQIVAPPPVITQSPRAPSAAEQIQSAFDKVLPPLKTAQKPPPPPAQPTPAPPATPPEAPEPPKDPPKTPETTPPPPSTDKKPEDVQKLPSFLEEALRSEPTPQKTSTQPAEEEWPEELPAFKTPEESKNRYKKWRESYNGLKKEVETLKSRPSSDPAQAERVNYLEGQNKQMAEVLSRVGVEQSVEFQQTIMQPLHASWNEAARIVRDAGGDPNELAKAMSLSGRSQFEALDTIFEGMPESAKIEANDALRTYRRYEEARRQAVANAPKTLEQLRKRETERQFQELGKQREEMKSMFERALTTLRDDAKLEILLKTNDPDTKWWNDQGDQIIEKGRNLFLENTDLGKMAYACLLAPAADAYRKLFIQSQKKVGELQKIISEKIGNEPTLSESGGPNGLTPELQTAEDLKLPFEKVFLRKIHEIRSKR